MNVSLIQPCIGRVGGKIVKRRRVIESLTVATVAGQTPKDIHLRFFDERVEEIDFDVETDLAGISVETLNAKRSYEIAREYRKRDIPVILGGIHPSLVPEEAQQHADAILIGQAENLWGRVIDDARRKRLQKIYYGEEQPVFGENFPERSIYRRKSYLPVRLIEIGRGCVHYCDFCSVHQFFGHQYATRSLDTLVAEIEQSDHKNFLVVDDNVFSDRRKTEEICRRLTPLAINWVGQASVSIANDERLLDRIAESGCKGLLIGFESVNAENLRQMNKRFNVGIEAYRKAVRRIKARKIRIYGSFVLGYDYETRQTIQETVDFSIDEKLTIATFYPLTPFPGTNLYKRLKQEKRLRNETWWLDPRCRYGDIFFHPRNMCAEELEGLCVQARRRFYGPKSFLLRALDLESNARNLESIYYYLLANILVNRDLAMKKRTSFGVEVDGQDL